MKEVTIYSTESCHYCQLAKQYFKEHNIAYTEHNVGADAEKRKEMIELSGQLGVPVIRVDDTVLVGFQEKMLEELLSKAA
ncbi:MAG: glutaredoxin family protein [Candidatus Pacebacteria bacterium]|nr:glutaredoxin family protein [Candidatus Paceibacterota bacterium]